MKQLYGKVPGGLLQDKWDDHRFDLKLVSPANRRRFNIIVVGTGLAGASVSASLAEMGYNVKQIELYSFDTNKTYRVLKPEKDPIMLEKFETTIKSIRSFHMNNYQQFNKDKCRKCIYEPACDRGLE